MKTTTTKAINEIGAKAASLIRLLSPAPKGRGKVNCHCCGKEFRPDNNNVTPVLICGDHRRRRRTKAQSPVRHLNF